MSRTSWTAFFVVVVLGGALNFLYLPAGSDSDKDKMAQAKEQLLTASIQTQKVNNCDISMKVYNSLERGKEGIHLRILASNPSENESQFTLPLCVYASNSSAASRVIPPPTLVIEQNVQVAVPAGKANETDVPLKITLKPPTEETITDSKGNKIGVRRSEVKSYMVYLGKRTKTGNQPELMCDFSDYSRPISEDVAMFDPAAKPDMSAQAPQASNDTGQTTRNTLVYATPETKAAPRAVSSASAKQTGHNNTKQIALPNLPAQNPTPPVPISTHSKK